MKWVVFCSLVLSAIVYFPIVFSTIFTHGSTGAARLWGYAPQQYIFNLWVFPFSAFAVCTVYYLLRTSVIKELPADSFAKSCIENWMIVLFTVLIFSSIIVIAVYTSASLSLDKLKPDYARSAISALNAINEDIDDMNGEESRLHLRKLRLDSRIQFESFSRTTEDSGELSMRLLEASPMTQLRVLQNPRLQRKLELLEPSLQSLSMFQLFANVVVGLLCLAAIIVTVIAANDVGYKEGSPPNIKAVINALSVAVMAFAVFPICYNQYRHQLEYFSGDDISVMADVIVMCLVVIALIFLQLIDPSNRLLSGVSAFKFVPALIVGAGTVAAMKSTDYMRQLIGCDTKLGTQVIIALVFIVAGSLTIWAIYPKSD